MKNLNFSIKIDAPKQIVWETLWNDTTYREWTRVFTEGSYAVSDWNEGSKIQFLDAKGDGMHSIIEKKVTNQLMAFKHLGIVSKGVEQPIGEKYKEWSDAKEIYHLKDSDGKTELSIELNSPEDMEDYFQKTFPKSLEIVKEISERGNAGAITD